MLVAAADNRVEAGAFLRALWPGDAGGLLLTCTRHGKPQSHQGPALGYCVRPNSKPCASLGWLPSHANHPPTPPKQGVAGNISQELAVQELLLHPEITCPTGDTTSGYDQLAQGCSNFHHFHAKCSHKDNTDKGTEEGAQPCKSS